MEGMSYEQMGFSQEKMKMMRQRLQEAATPIGLQFSNERKFAPNTIMAHLLTEYAEEHGGAAKQVQVGDRLLKEFFGNASTLDRDFLIKVASDMGLDVQDVSSYITSPEHQKSLKVKARAWSDKGVHGVPYFIMNGRPTFSGAQESDVFKSTILKLANMSSAQKDKNSSL